MIQKIQRQNISRVTGWSDRAFVMLTGGFIGSLVISHILAIKLAGWQLPFIGEIIFPAGVIAYAATFLFTDVISECYGKKSAIRVVWAGFFTSILIIGFIQLALSMPSASMWAKNDSFQELFGYTTRIILASLVAYLVSQHIDIWIFHELRDSMRGKRLWLRNNLATMAAQSIDTIIFILLAYYGDAPLVKLIIGQLIIKWLIALLDTPVVYLLTALIGARPIRSKIS